MSFAQRLDLRQTQQLVMTPQLQQAIKMLQMSNLELREFIDQELERNPLLERAEHPDAPTERAEPAPAQPEGVDRELGIDRLARAEETFDSDRETLYGDESRADRLCERAAESAEYAPTLDGPHGAASQEAAAWSTVGAGGSSKFDDDEFGLEGRVASGVTLREHLLAQLGMARLTPDVRLVAADLIEQVDECGYLRIDLDEVGRRLGASLGVVTAALRTIQSFDPAGVGARSLTECLMLQLRDRDRLDPAMQALIDNLDLFAARKYDRLRAICGVDADDLREMAAELRALDPKPGLAFERDPVQVVAPDVFVFESRLGGWTVELNGETLPRLLLNTTYAARVLRSARPSDRSREVKEYLTERQQTASWLLKSIDQRARTILKVASEIVRQQDGFFAHGVSGLRPLNLKRVADAIEMHESTVSRVTSNKYIATPRGMFEMKYFFTPAIGATDGGDSYSAEAIRHRIKALIDGESAETVLSDDRIVAILRGSGVDIARRTVTKYREALGIPSSIQRRRDKSALTVL